MATNAVRPQISTLPGALPGAASPVAASMGPHEQVEQLVLSLVQAWQLHSPGRITDARSINEGPCREFADELVDDIHKAMPGAQAKVMDDLDVLEPQGLSLPNHVHAFVWMDGMYYDAEAPQGCASWRSLPFFARLRHLLDAQEYDEDDDAGDSRDADDGQELDGGPSGF